MLTKKQICTYRRHARRAFLSKALRTCRVQFNEHTQRAERRRFKYLLKKVVKNIVLNHLQDNVKAPHCNRGKSALLLPSSFDIYFGQNIQITSDGYVTRTAYGTGTGATTISLDPRYATIKYLFPDLEELRALVEKKSKQHYQEQKRDVNCSYNHVSVKLYFNKKKTGEHTDISFGPKHARPTRDNSQVPGSSVAIATLGDTKLLKFIQYQVGAGKQKRTNKKVTMVQESGSLIMMDPDDEFLSKDNTFWKHRSDLVNGSEDVCISLMFRVVQSERAVEPLNGKFREKTIPDEWTKARLDHGWDLINDDRESYDNICQRIYSKINNKLSSYWK